MKSGSMRVLQLAVGGFDHNFSYAIGDEDTALIDPTGAWQVIEGALAGAGISSVRHILLTHGHSDHREALEAALRAFPEAEVCGHPGNSAAHRHLADGETLSLGKNSIEVLYTPGHSRDSVCYLCDRSALFTGDTLFVGCIGFAPRPESMYSSLKRLAKLPGDITVYPGHDYGRVPFRTLAEEKRENPYLGIPTLEEFKIQLKELI